MSGPGGTPSGGSGNSASATIPNKVSMSHLETQSISTPRRNISPYSVTSESSVAQKNDLPQRSQRAQRRQGVSKTSETSQSYVFSSARGYIPNAVKNRSFKPVDCTNTLSRSW